ncbi:putative Ig domain-containing protein [uncultured Gimesia sp.]|uniref:putative Ig domain-containing protein n=1 Tax=uncultured Gimesia sp. TaxID=1678688 RepID=UPI0030DC217A
MFFNKSSKFYQRFITCNCQNLFQNTSRSVRRSRKAASYSIVRTENLEERQLLAADDLTDLSDDFEDAATIANWQRIYETEGWDADQLETWNIDDTQEGKMVLAPHTTVWFENYRGPLVYKELTGDFVVTTQVQIGDRDDIGDNDLDDVPDGSQFSLAGLMIRTPRNIVNPEVDWSLGSQADDGTNNGENYVFLSLGWGSSGDQFQMETKTTRNSDSNLVLQDMGNNSIINLQIARIGDTVFTLYQFPGEEWVLNRRIPRSDLPETLQVGMVTYTDWEKANDYVPFDQNNNILQPGGLDPTPDVPFQPDLIAGFEYIQFDRPEIPESLQGLNLGLLASDSQLLSFLGDNVNSPAPINPTTDSPMEIGMNLASIADWNSAWTFIDMAHTMRSWNNVSLNLETNESISGSTLFDLELDENGWPMETHQTVNELGQTIIQQYISPILTGNVNPAGIYRAEWDGEALVLLPGVIEQGVTPEGRNYALLDLAENQNARLRVLDINPANYFRNFNLWMPEYNGQSFVGQDWQPGESFSPFHPLFLERLEPFETLRFMDWMEANLSDVVTWDDRAQLSDATYFAGSDRDDFHNGIAPEYMIELSNTLDANAWFNMPHQADESFVRNFAELVRDTLDPELTIYVEWSNEIWNFANGFDASRWIQEQLTLPENAGMNRFEFSASQIQEDFAIWEDVFAGQEDRLVRVVAGQQANPNVLASLLASMDGNFDAISVTAYAGLRQDQLATFDEFTTADDIIDSLLEVSVPWSLGHLAEHQAIANQYSEILGREIDLVTYEGGSHPSAYNTPAQDAAHEASLSPRMYDVYQTLLNGSQQIGVDLYNQFTFTGGGAPARWGDWGLLHTMDQPLEESYEYQSILDFINDNDVVPVVNIESPVSEVEELGTSTLEFVLTRSEDQLDQPLTVNYEISGTATPDDDFNNLTGEITFLANETSTTLIVSILEDLIDEEDESIEIQLLDDDHYVLGEVSLATGLILDNDFTNVAPVAGTILDQDIQEGTPFLLNVNDLFSDANAIDGDQLTLAAMLSGDAVLPEWLVFNAETRQLSGTPGIGDAGIYDIVITATDLAGLEASSSFQLNVSPLLFTQYDLSVVKSPSATSENGETPTLAESASFLHEWETYWVEVWGSISNSSDTGSDTGIETFYFNLNYNTEYTTATSIEYGAAFTEGQSGEIDDASGTIRGISASTNLSDAGDDQFILLVRIEFTPTDNDQVSIDDETQSIGPYQAGFAIEQPEFQLTDQTGSQMGAVNVAEAEFWAVPYDANDDDAINFRDLLVLINAYGKSSSNANVPQAWLMDYNQSGSVNFRDLVLLISNYGKSKSNDSNVTLPPNFPNAWISQNLIAGSMPQLQQQVATPLTIEQATSTAQAAIQAYSESVSPEKYQVLKNTKIELADLPGKTLAKAMPGTILIDVSAAGHGWFVDNTPWTHSEFHTSGASEWKARTNSQAARRIDLLTTIYHELEHQLGHQHESSGVRKPTLSPGIRRLPAENVRAHHNQERSQKSDQFFSSLNDNDLLAFG